MSSKEAQKAMDVEWEDLRTIKRPNPKDKGKDKGKGVWDVSKVLEAKDAATKARKEGKKAHFARICELCYEKGSGLRKGHKARVYKGRAVLLGDNVKDED